MSATATTTPPTPPPPTRRQTAAEATPDTSATPRAVIARLDPASARIKWLSALTP